MMTLVEQFENFLDENKFDKSCIRIVRDEEEKATYYSFNELSPNDNIYDVSFLFYDDAINIEIWVRKFIEKKSKEEINNLYEKFNHYNIEYIGKTFVVLTNEIIGLKSTVFSNQDIHNVIQDLGLDLQIADDLFKNIN